MSNNRLSSLQFNLNNLYEQLAGEEKALILEEEANKIRIQQKIRKTKERIQNFEQEYILLLSKQVEKDGLSEPIAEEVTADLIDEFDVIYTLEKRQEIKSLLVQILAELQKPDKPASAKLRVALPIIPSIVSYNLEGDTGSIVRRLFPTFVKAYKGLKSLASLHQSKTQPKLLSEENAEDDEDAELVSERGVSYTNLKCLLKAHSWSKADSLTKKLMRQALYKPENYHRFKIEDFRSFPRVDFLTINHLWDQYSEGRFGFSIQKKILISCGISFYTDAITNKICHEFINRVGWKVSEWGELKSEVGTGVKSMPRGHYPKEIFNQPDYNDIPDILRAYSTIFSFGLLRPYAKSPVYALFSLLKSKKLPD
ncbi:GUN4 domain-containing protein [Lusitaniella coriacea]|uniref:GUN4 domain-containing protein n=1 Tax=Lusitaniella coriacea TaxID=1983105 RepID=UPI003CF83322